MFFAFSFVSFFTLYFFAFVYPPIRRFDVCVRCGGVRGVFPRAFSSSREYAAAFGGPRVSRQTTGGEEEDEGRGWTYIGSEAILVLLAHGALDGWGAGASSHGGG